MHADISIHLEVNIVMILCMYFVDLCLLLPDKKYTFIILKFRFFKKKMSVLTTHAVRM